MAKHTTQQLLQALPVVIASGVFVLIYNAVLQSPIEIPPDVLGHVWA